MKSHTKEHLKDLARALALTAVVIVVSWAAVVIVLYGR